MTDRKKPLLKLSPISVQNIFTALRQTGRQFVGEPLELGGHTITITRCEDGLIPAGKVNISHKADPDIFTKVINVYHLKDGRWVYSTPSYKMRKLNGYTTRSTNDLAVVYPSNAFAVYQIKGTWQGELSLESLDLEITKIWSSQK